MNRLGQGAGGIATLLSAISTAESATNPRSAASSHPFLASKTQKVRPAGDNDMEALLSEWRIRAQRSAGDALRKALESHDSMTAYARAAQSLAEAGNYGAAIEMAIKVLEIADVRAADGSGRLDVPAAYAAVRVLLMLEQGPKAANFLNRHADIPLLAQIGAELLVAQGRLSEALVRLQRPELSDSPGVPALKGYILVLDGKCADAVTELRQAVRDDGADVNSALNLAAAFWNLGSSKKAINWARYASRVAPGREDATLALIHYLIDASRLDEAGREVQKLVGGGVVATTEFVLLRAYLAGRLEKYARAYDLLKQAQNLARAANNTRAHAELDGAITFFQFGQGWIRRNQALERVRTSLSVERDSIALVATLASLAFRRKSAPEVRAALSCLSDSELNHPLTRGIEGKLAFLEGRFEDLESLVQGWQRVEPLNEKTVRLSTFWLGALAGDWREPARHALSAIREIGLSRPLANAAAYALSMTGQGDAALGILQRVDISEYQMIATLGLAHLARGSFDEGLRLYRQAARLADSDKSAPDARCVMTIYQSMGIRHLGILERVPKLVAAGALPPVSLPVDWKDQADYCFYEEVARRRGWPWPVFVG